MSYTMLNSIELKNAVFVNDRKNSSVNIEAKHTEDGKKWLYLQKLQNNKDPVLSCQVTYLILKQLEAIRDSASDVVLSMKDGRVFNVMIKDLDPKAFFDFIEYDDDDRFDLTITLIEV